MQDGAEHTREALEYSWCRRNAYRLAGNIPQGELAKCTVQQGQLGLRASPVSSGVWVLIFRGAETLGRSGNRFDGCFEATEPALAGEPVVGAEGFLARLIWERRVEVWDRDLSHSQSVSANLVHSNTDYAPLLLG